MPLAKHREPVTVELTTPGEWVKLKARLSSGDEARIKAASFRTQVDGQLDGKVGDIVARFDYEAAQFVGLEVGIVDWHVGDGNGGLAELTPANIRELLPEDFDLIVSRANELWEPHQDPKASGPSLPTITLAEDDSRASSSGSP